MPRKGTILGMKHELELSTQSPTRDPSLLVTDCHTTHNVPIRETRFSFMFLFTAAAYEDLSSSYAPSW